jgi:hypothetical protein
MRISRRIYASREIRGLFSSRQHETLLQQKNMKFKNIKQIIENPFEGL